ncbi:MAG TPA: hypothetical protein VE173_10895, partial [Longimicrobiales bacterium]|nr:hypothetical protein [Longimicrobiales bacterium]
MRPASASPATRAVAAFACTAALFLLPLAPLPAPAAPLAAQSTDDGKGTVPPEDWGKWESLAGSALSPDGSWLAVQIRRVDEDGELRIRPVGNPDSVVTVPNGSGARFSADGRWLAYVIGVGEDQRERLQDQDRPVRNSVGLLDLRSGDTTSVEAVASFAFSPDGRWLAMQRYAPRGERDARGMDLVVRDLEGGRDTNFGSIAEFAWSDVGPLLALLVDAEGMAGNGIQLYDAGTRRLVTLDSKSAR